MLRTLALSVTLFGSIFSTPLSAQEPGDGGRASEDRSVLDSMEPAMIFELANREGELGALVEPILNEMLSPSDVVEGWSETGVNLADAIAEFEQDGEKAHQYELSEIGLSITYTGEPQSFLSDAYFRHSLFVGTASGTLETSLMQIFPGIWLQGQSGTRTIGNARCSAGVSHIDLLAKDPMSQWPDEAIGMTMVMYGLFQQLAEADLCVVYSKAEEGGFTTKSFTSDGNLLAALSEGNTVSRLADREEILRLITDHE